MASAEFDMTPYGIPHVLRAGFNFKIIKQRDLSVGSRQIDSDGKTVGFTLGPTGTKYTILQKLGEGAYGVGYKTMDPDGKEYAIKFIKEKLTKPEEFIAFLKESIIQLLVVDVSKAETYGPFAPRIHEICFDVARGEGFIRSDLMRAKLDDLISSYGPADNDIVVPDALNQLARMLSFLQKKLSFNHRDLKGDNIMYVRSPDGRFRLMRLIDFGMSCVTWNGLKISGSTWFDKDHSCFKVDRDMAQLLFYISRYHGTKLSPALLDRLNHAIIASVGPKHHKCQMEKLCPRYGLKDWRSVYNFVDRRNVHIPGGTPTFVMTNMRRFMDGEPFVAPVLNLPAAAAPICPPGKVLNPATDRCVKAAKVAGPKICPPGKVLNPATRRCVKAAKVADGPKICPPGKVLNPATRRCVKAAKVADGPKICPPGKVLNPATDRCVKAAKVADGPKICPPGKVLNPATRRCVKAAKVADEPKICPPGKVLNPATDRCVKAAKVADEPKICPPGKVLNPKTRRCVKEKGARGRTRKARRN